ncbi:MAG: hypothetical protein BroJett040_16450 [Oligoflexia bacterium]|nr:MAG: hypothetical protein BroJett040_16450 [Oligoflexia bacterium]
MSKYYLYHQGQQQGPFSDLEIVTKYVEKAFDATTYIFDSLKNDWVLLVEHPLFMQALARPAMTEVDHIVNQMEQLADHRRQKKWFVMRNEVKTGPFNMLEVIQLLQEKKIFEFDHITNSSLKSWKRIADCEDFSRERVRSLKQQKDADVVGIFKDRQYARVNYDSQILVHNNKSVWKGQSYEIGTGGAGLALADQTLQLDQTVFLHFKVGSKIPPFNAICTIVNKQASKAGAEIVKYGVKFTNISKSIQDRIKEFSSTSATDKSA